MAYVLKIEGTQYGLQVEGVEGTGLAVEVTSHVVVVNEDIEISETALRKGIGHYSSQRQAPFLVAQAVRLWLIDEDEGTRVVNP